MIIGWCDCAVADMCHNIVRLCSIIWDYCEPREFILFAYYEITVNLGRFYIVCLLWDYCEPREFYIVCLLWDYCEPREFYIVCLLWDYCEPREFYIVCLLWTHLCSHVYCFTCFNNLHTCFKYTNTHHLKNNLSWQKHHLLVALIWRDAKYVLCAGVLLSRDIWVGPLSISHNFLSFHLMTSLESNIEQMTCIEIYNSLPILARILANPSLDSCPDSLHK